MSIYDFTVKGKRDEDVQLSEFEGKVVLIINTATECGFTPQYDKLQDLYEKYAGEGFVILDFPCNQFGNQAPGSYDEIVSFCDSTYGITFPILSKIDVKGEDAEPLYQYLTSQKGFKGFTRDNELSPKLEEMLSKEDPEYYKKPDIKWNFTKFLIDREGNVVERFEPTEPLDVVEDRIQELLSLS